MSPESATERRPTIVELIRDRVLDAELAALLWLLADGRVPLVVAGPAGSGRATLLDAILDLVGPAIEPVRLDPGDPEVVAAVDAAAGPAVLAVPELLAGAAPISRRGALARAVVRALGRGVGLATTIRGDRLEDVFARLRGPAAGVAEDQLTFLGVVVILGPDDPPDGPDRARVRVAHYVRPLARDAHGHVQRLGPAVLATAAEPGRWEHFGWGIAPELADRIGLRPGDLEPEQARRAALLDGLVEAGVDDPASIRLGLAGIRHLAGHPPV